MEKIWTEKYRITREEELYGYRTQLNKIKRWLLDFKACKKGTKRAMLLVGCPGTGKTSIAKFIFDEFGYTTLLHNASNNNGIERVLKIIEYGAKGLKYMDGLDSTIIYGVILDEIEGLSNTKACSVKELAKLINPNGARRKTETFKLTKNTSPVIFIANDIRNTKVKDLLKICEKVEFNRPEQSIVNGYIKSINAKEKIGMNDIEMLELSGNISPDFRTVLLFLQYLKYQKKNESQMKRDDDKEIGITYYLSNFENKEHDAKLTDRIRKLFGEDITLENVWNEYNREKSMISMVIHENYPSWISDWKSRLNAIDSLIIGDMIDKIMYNSQKWSYRNIHSAIVVYNIMKEKQVLDGCVNSFLPQVTNDTVLRRYSEICAKRDKRKEQLIMEMMLESNSINDTDIPEEEIKYN